MCFSKKFPFFAILLFAFHCELILGSQSAEILREDFNPSKLAAIQILPFRVDPSSSQSQSSVSFGAQATSPVFDPQHMYGRQYTSSKDTTNEFGLGTTFRYLTQAEVKEIDSKNTISHFMRQVINYHKTFNGGIEQNSMKNVLLVRMRIIASATSSSGETSTAGADEPYEYFFGIFVSGGQDEYRCGEIRNLITVNEKLPESLKRSLQSKGFSDLWGNKKIRDQLKEVSLLEDSIPDSLTMDDAENLLSVGVYTTNIFRLNAGAISKKLAPHSNKEYGDLRITMESRLDFTTAKKKPQKPTSEQEKYRLEISSTEEALRRSNLTYALFGKPCYNDIGDDKACLGSGCELYFNQSEQAFLSWLGHMVVIGGGKTRPHWCTTKPLDPGKRYNILKFETTLFSFLDICRYCRGTMAYMMGSDKMKNILQGLFQNLKIDADIPKEAIQLFAFSYEKTDV